MDDDILSKVVEVEREVRQKLDIERKMSQEWLETVKKEAEDRVLAEEIGLMKAVDEAMEDARSGAGEKTAAIINSAAKEAERIRGLSDGTLKETVLKHISLILPGRHHDSENVQG